MLITPKPTPDPVAEIRIPEAVMRWALLAAEETIGKQSMAVVLRKAGLEILVDKYPRENLDTVGAYTVGDYARLQMTLVNFVGAADLYTAHYMGRITYRHSLNRYAPLVIGAAPAALKMLPAHQRLRLGLDAMKVVWDKVFTVGGQTAMQITVQDRGDRLAWCNRTCILCAGQQADHPCCHMGTSYLCEGVIWLMDAYHEVREVACRAAGDPACEWEISKNPKE